ncbi:MAG: methyltetrahydrofolate:corrinoid methyltransferase [Peptococcaceae bacterium BICA1-8]|nr:MAG: methyltetrahydrofolate:corrinoid methyltransferase [Peptococcaceae bacterium BICA1-8]
MLIVGELINSSRSMIKEALEKMDSTLIQEIAQKQVEAGAHYIDVNCGTQVYNEPEIMTWLVKTISDKVSAPLCIDSPNPKVLEAGLSSINNNFQPMINSITAEAKKFSEVIPLVVEYKVKVIALCMDDRGMPKTTEDRLQIADKLVNDLVLAGVKEDDIHLDPLVQPVSFDSQAGVAVLETLLKLKELYPRVHKICGLSNVSFGLPTRKIINQTFMIQTMTAGMDSYILDPLDKKMMGFIYSSQALLGKDDFCMNYISAHRKGIYTE